MKRLSLSTFLTFAALSVAGLVSHSSAQQGPPATQPPAQGPSAAQPQAPPAQQGPCQQIVAACRQAGFVQGGAKTGVGLGVDCVRPILQGTAQRRKASKALPQVDQQIVAACKARNPNFGKANASPAGSNPTRYATRARRLLENHRCAREGQIMTQSLFLYRHANVLY